MVRSSPSQGEDIGSNPLPNNLDTHSNTFINFHFGQKKAYPVYYCKDKNARRKYMAQINWFNSMNNYSAKASVCPDTLITFRGYHQPYIFKPIYH